ncbi:fumarylacetoacetate hydrolase family protein [Rhodococcus sp. NPDC057014]|uniref:fumarylacetoacetate hydrolase family protein n=1 Tax=Rhodococcus sp. NPDC057014 TaxID=3346000 RepID=UPI00363B658C
MRFGNYDGRATLIAADNAGYDVAKASHGTFGPEPAAVLDVWDDFTAWAATAELADGKVDLDRALLGPPSPAPRQIFAIGLNYHDHAAESGVESPTGLPPVFSKFQTCLTGPDTTVDLPEGGHTDWEVELVAVIGKRAANVDASDAWSFVAGLTVGQDISERIAQLQGPLPQFGFAKSRAGFGPTGPWLVTPDEFADRDDLEIGCTIDGVEVQRARTSDLIYSVPRLIAELSAGVTLLPGDLVFTGTPAGVGLGRTPQRWLQPGEHLRSWVEGIGELNQRFV